MFAALRMFNRLCMPLTNSGAVGFASAFFAFVTAPFLGVGDSTTAFAQSQTDLQASTNKLRKAMDAGYPQRASGTLTFRSTYNTAEGNYPWNEWGVFDAGSGGTMYSRKQESLGTKTSAQTWQLTATATVAAA
jgi:hypothetical protein